MSKQKHFLGWKIVFAAMLLISVLVWWYAADYDHADEAALAVMAADAEIRIMPKENITVFMPQETDTGFIFYPGGKVEAAAYAPLMKGLADQGFSVCW